MGACHLSNDDCSTGRANVKCHEMHDARAWMELANWKTDEKNNNKKSYMKYRFVADKNRSFWPMRQRLPSQHNRGNCRPSEHTATYHLSHGRRSGEHYKKPQKNINEMNLIGQRIFSHWRRMFAINHSNFVDAGFSKSFRCRTIGVHSHIPESGVQFILAYILCIPRKMRCNVRRPWRPTSMNKLAWKRSMDFKTSIRILNEVILSWICWEPDRTATDADVATVALPALQLLLACLCSYSPPAAHAYMEFMEINSKQPYVHFRHFNDLVSCTSCDKTMRTLLALNANHSTGARSCHSSRRHRNAAHI